MAKTYPKKNKLDNRRVPRWDMIDGCEPLQPEDPGPEDNVSFCDQCGRWIPATEEAFEKKIVVEEKKGRVPEKTVKYNICNECNDDWDGDI